MERESQDPAVSLKLQVEGRRLPEGGQKGIPRECARRELHEALGELERLLALVAVQAQNEVGLNVRNVFQDQVHVLRYRAHLVHAADAPGTCLVPEVEPRLDPGQDRLEAIRTHAFEMRLRKERQAAFGEKVDAPRGHGAFDRVQVIVESHAEVRIVPGYPRSSKLRAKEAQVLLNLLVAQRLVFDGRVDAEAARVRATEAPDHRDDLE